MQAGSEGIININVIANNVAILSCNYQTTPQIPSQSNPPTHPLTPTQTTPQQPLQTLSKTPSKTISEIALKPSPLTTFRFVWKKNNYRIKVKKNHRYSIHTNHTTSSLLIRPTKSIINSVLFQCLVKSQGRILQTSYYRVNVLDVLNEGEFRE